LRDKIYAFASDTIIITKVSDQGVHHRRFEEKLCHRVVDSGSMLLSVCKQTNSEATRHLQTSKIIRLDDYIDPLLLYLMLGLGLCFHPHTIELHTSVLARMRAEVYRGRATGEFCGWCDMGDISMIYMTVQCVSLRQDPEERPFGKQDCAEALDILTTIFGNKELEVFFPVV
jgi:hypothetical protein